MTQVSSRHPILRCPLPIICDPVYITHCLSPTLPTAYHLITDLITLSPTFDAEELLVLDGVPCVDVRIEAPGVWVDAHDGRAREEQLGHPEGLERKPAELHLHCPSRGQLVRAWNDQSN